MHGQIDCLDLLGKRTGCLHLASTMQPGTGDLLCMAEGPLFQPLQSCARSTLLRCCRCDYSLKLIDYNNRFNARKRAFQYQRGFSYIAPHGRQMTCGWPMFGT